MVTKGEANQSEDKEIKRRNRIQHRKLYLSHMHHGSVSVSDMARADGVRER